MENIRFSVFDVFAYLLPGTVVLTAIVLFSTPNIADISQYLEMAKDISLGLGVIVVFVSYILGNVTDNLGSWLYYKVGCKIWGNPYPKGGYSTLSHAKQRALIREFSPENFLFIHTWKVLNSMSHNMSFAMLLFAIAAFTRYAHYRVVEWSIISAVSLISATILLNRASIYDKWHYKEMVEIIDVLKLEEKVGSVAVSKLKRAKPIKNA